MARHLRTDGAALARAVQEMADRAQADPSAAGRIASVTATLEENLRSQVRFNQHGRDFAFQSDELTVLGGEATAPSPMRYFLSGVAFCELVWCAKGAALVGCELESLEVDVQAYLDVRGEHKVGDGVPPYPQWFVVGVTAGSPCVPEAVLRMVDEAEGRCPVMTLIKRAAPVYGRVVHNGAVIRNSVPAEIAAEIVRAASAANRR